MRPAWTDELADPELTAFVEAARAPGPSVRELGAAAVRRAQRERVMARPRGPELAEVSDRDAAGVPVRVYRPGSVRRGTVVYAHGGMWTIGDLDSHDRVCRRLAATTGATVVAVDYRRAPEHPWPAAVDDVLTVIAWACEGGDAGDPGGPRDGGGARDGAGGGSGGDAGRNASDGAGGGPLVVMGDSAGGHLVTLACLRLRDEGGPMPGAQVLVCPNTDLTLSLPSTRTLATGWGLDVDDVAWGVEGWVPDPGMRARPAVSPLFAQVGGLPRAVVVTSEYDPLRDEGDAYAARLAEAGVPVTHRREPGMVHGFLTLDTLSPAAAAAGERVFADVATLLEDLVV
ncbi:alpha/beta hydrolase [Nonomuraea sp. FMUSA5-5]|uniref:Alpha/beta hydrolase n=1 Tax=Nonomuraea composti TaxID=2720023 RepID=A0ABX1BNG5_9ACTN|nr:alpha/beta hydrolase [Nonomuraea sp. FMUSA5-5]NJP98582.1 alpha/beta hydrolase [Nonomuraea sp. FMUSA5-5]